MDSNESNTNLGENIVLTEETNMSLLKKLFKSKYFLLAIAIIVILVALLTYKGVKDNNLIKSFSDKVYPGAYILDKDISGQTADELHKTLVSMMTVGGDK